MLLTEAQTRQSTDPALAASIFMAAKPYVSELGQAQMPQALALLHAIISQASDSGFATEHPETTATFLSTALAMAQQPNIAHADTTLASTASAALQHLTASNPSVLKNTQDTPVMAQHISVPTPVSASAALIPSPE